MMPTAFDAWIGIAIIFLFVTGMGFVLLGISHSEDSWMIFLGAIFLMLSLWGICMIDIISNSLKTNFTPNTKEAVTCPTCRVEVDTTFCGGCGWKAKPLILYCPTCDNLIEDKFCTNCGLSREDAERISEEKILEKAEKTLDNQE